MHTVASRAGRWPLALSLAATITLGACADDPVAPKIPSKPNLSASPTGDFIEVTVTAYRSPGDERPSVASAWEVWPGRTPYTKDSEAMNCETSAAGRALAFLGLEVRRSVATRQDIEHRAEPARADKRRLAALRGGMTKIAKTTKARQELVQLILGYPPPETLDGLGLAEVEEVERAVVDLLDGRTRLELDEQGDQRIVANVPEEVPDGAA